MAGDALGFPAGTDPMRAPGGFAGGAIIGCVITVLLAKTFLSDSMPDSMQPIGTGLLAIILFGSMFMALTSGKASFNEVAMALIFAVIVGYALVKSHNTGGAFATIEESGAPYYPWVHPGLREYLQ